MVFCIVPGILSQSLRVSGHGSEISGYGFWEYPYYEQVVFEFLVSTIGTRERRLIHVLFQE